MQDRFKFRFWHKPTKKMINCYSYDPVFVIGTDYNPAKFEDCILMQCTGLKDKNGKLIYEGDIVDKGTICKWIITWFKNRFILVPDFEYKNKDKCANDRECGFKYFENNHSYADEDTEVIGNRYQNEDLLPG